MLVLALTDQDLVTDDVGAEQSGRFLSPFLQLFEAADVPAVDEYLRHGAPPGDRTNDPRAVAVTELHLRVRVAEALQQGLRLGAEPAAFTWSGFFALGLTWFSIVSASDTSNGSPGFSASMNIFSMTPFRTSME